MVRMRVAQFKTIEKYITVKLIKCRIRRNNFLLRMVMLSSRKPSKAKLALFAKLN